MRLTLMRGWQPGPAGLRWNDDTATREEVMTVVDRRTLLRTTTAGAAVGGPFAGLVAMPAGSHEPPSRARLVPLADERDGKVRLHLPKGFRYRSFHDTETP